ncbi:MAG: hemerythrin domain-containing protein [Burkholderiales bacterium]|nr:hemerythrin domain-containing protein [Burkholderiales bacterium]
MNIFEALRLSHDTQRALAARISDSKPGSPERDEIYRELKRELAAHAAAEERCFYLPLIEHNASMGQARHGMAEHHEMDEMVKALDELGAGAGGWGAKFGELRHKVEHHLEDEEHTIFQLAGKVLTEQQKTKLAKDYEAEFATFRFDKVPVSSAESE